MMNKTDFYGSFASVYDLFRDNVDYESWCRHIVKVLQRYGIQDGLVCELGCGTGIMTELLSRAGYDMIGIDCSEEMLTEAMEKKVLSGQDILYLLQDMREFELYGTVKAVICILDSLNYMTEEEDLLKVFRLVNNYLDPGGLFLFDINTEYKYRELLGNRAIVEQREEGSFIWENDYDSESGIHEYAITLFLPAENGLYEKHEEFHYQKAWTPSQVTEMLVKAGLQVEGIYEAYTDSPPEKRGERLLFIAREKDKESGRKAE